MPPEQLDLPGTDFDGVRPKRRPSRGMYLLPSLLTAANIAAGYYAITQSVQGTVADPSYFDHAALAIGLAALLDGVDGFIARVTNTASDFGKELDSLADVITFGVAPSLLAYIWGFRMLPVPIYPELRDNVVHAGVLFCFSSAARAGWRGSTSVSTRSRETPASQARSSSSACRFLPGRA